MNNQSSNFLVGTIEEGITNNTKPWATQKDSWEVLTNMYQWRGRIVRKAAYSTLGQLSFVIASQIAGASAQNFTAALFTVFSLSGVTIVPRFTTLTVSGGANYTLREDLDNPGSIIFVSGANSPAFLNGSINYLTGALVLNFAAAGPPAGNVVITFSYAYGLPVMGLRTRELFELNEQDTIGFDTRFAYRYSNTSDQFVPLASIMATEWSGTNSQFFFTTNYAGSFWATNSKPGLHGVTITAISNTNPAVVTANNTYTNGQTVVIINVTGYAPLAGTTPTINGRSFIIANATPTTFELVGLDGALYGAYSSGGTALNSFVSQTNQDGIRYYGALTNGTGWANYNPPVDTNNALVGALLIFPYRGYLVFLNTTEGNEAGVFNYGNRARWTQIGTPYYSLPVPSTPNPQGVDINAARDDLFGRGGANDAPTQEVIIGAAFIRDILIVYFERSAWRLRFVNNAQNPFVWERINVELGASSTFSTIAFDKGLMAIGERGIVMGDANDVVRIDEKIPDQIFEVRIPNDGMQRIYGIRTFMTKLNYWTIPSNQNPQGVYPDYVLVYNYDTKTWANFDDCFTCFGYFYAFNDATWADLTEAWSTYGDVTWGGGLVDAGSENLLAGNQQGFVLNLDGNRMNVQGSANGQNGPSLMISAITNGTSSIFNSKDNNLPDGSWVVLSGIAGTTDANGVSLEGRSFKVVNPSGAAQPDTFSLQEFTAYSAGLATGGTFTFTLASPFIPIFPGSVNIYVGTLHFTDNDLNGVLKATGSLSTGIIDYQTGVLTLFFVPVLAAPTQVYIHVVSQDPVQGLSNLETIGTYTGGGYIAKISNFDIQTKVFNFLPQDKRSRLSRIDFYMDTTETGEFTTNVFADSSNEIINTPLNDNLRSNVVKTTKGQYQFGTGEETIFRLYANAIAQTIQVQCTLTDQQMAVPVIAGSNVELLALNFSLRPGGRLI